MTSVFCVDSRITEEESGEITGFLGEHQPMQQLLLSTVQGISDHVV